jgi:methionyl-tRNA synthetase
MSDERILITSALPYINGVKHLGNLVGSMLPADVYARFERGRLGADKVLFICATDEHGTPTELAALEAKQDVAQFCAEQHALQAGVGARFGLSWDYFGRSSSPENRALTQHFAQRLWERGLIDVRVTKQVYSRADKRFLPDRYVEGTCPHCGYEKARGDQCENCTRVLDPTDLIAPRSAVSGSTEVEIRESKHLFLKQSLFVDDLRRWIDSKSGMWPHLVTSIARKWLDEGLHDRGITRDLAWGVPVNAGDWGPNPQGERLDPKEWRDKVFYVWFDAPIEYIGATSEWAHANGRGEEAWRRWWHGEAARDVTYVEFMGKDNIPFHTVGFPVTLMGSGEPWKLVDKIKGFNWINYYSGKFSTSQKRGVFMDQALEILPADYWRWYLMANAPEGADTNFTWEHFQSVVNKDLADVLGNFVNRIMRFAAARYAGRVPDGGALGSEEEALFAELDARARALETSLEALEFRKGMAELRAIWVAGNEYVTRAAPWTVIKDNPARAAVAVRMGLNLVHLFAHLSWPIIPETARRMHEAVMPAPDIIPWPREPIAEFMGFVPPGEPFTVPEVLFKKIDDSQVEAWKQRFGGT